MVQGFEELSEEKFTSLKDGVAWITLLIAGADGVIDENEKEWAQKLTEIRSYSLPNDLVNFYAEVGKDFSDKIEKLISELPNDKIERNKILARNISGLNDILAELNPEMASELYKSFKSFAKHVAKASGGILGMMSISKEEEELIDLPMLNEIHTEDQE